MNFVCKLALKATATIPEGWKKRVAPIAMKVTIRWVNVLWLIPLT
jgi:uncharacterized protein YbdZ (MbtH family)